MFRTFNSSTNEIEITFSKDDIYILLDFACIAPCEHGTSVLMCDLFRNIINEMNKSGCDSIKYTAEV